MASSLGSSSRFRRLLDHLHAEGGQKKIEDDAAFVEVFVLGGKDEFDDALGAGDKGVARPDAAELVQAVDGVHKAGRLVAGGATGHLQEVFVGIDGQGVGAEGAVVRQLAGGIGGDPHGNGDAAGVLLEDDRLGLVVHRGGIAPGQPGDQMLAAGVHHQRMVAVPPSIKSSSLSKARKLIWPAAAREKEAQAKIKTEEFHGGGGIRKRPCWSGEKSRRRG